jgi:heme/copper-type cytochrome/quinol oxidase subunit 2
MKQSVPVEAIDILTIFLFVIGLLIYLAWRYT